MTEIVIINNERCVTMRCKTCAVTHAFPEIIYETCRKEGGYWACPNGHQRGWAKGAEQEEIAVLRRERDRLKQNEARLCEEITLERERARTAEKKILQVKRRANAGVCQCCNRTFIDVVRHMKTKHPNVVPLALKT